MRRIAHIAVTLVMVLLLVRPFDCFSGTLTAKAADCCAKGKCLPTPNADDCCKGAPTAGDHLLASKLHSQLAPVPDMVAAPAPVHLPELLRAAARYVHQTAAPPGSPPLLGRNLPLLI
ncbi:MAG: hypothetical protein ABJC09_14480 [Terriglobia bacterium]